MMSVMRTALAPKVPWRGLPHFWIDWAADLVAKVGDPTGGPSGTSFLPKEA